MKNKLMLLTALLTISLSSNAFEREVFRAKIKESLENRLTHSDNVKADFENISYGNHQKQKIDVYPSKIINNEMHPIIVMVHGGGWKRGDKAASGVVDNKVNYYTKKGFILVSVNYRLTPEVTPYEQAQDIGQAIEYVQKNASSWNGNPNKVILMGHSAGAHLVTLVTADAGKVFAKNTLPWLGTVSLDGAGVDIEKSMAAQQPKLLDEIYDNAFGNDPLLWKSVSPMAQINNKSYPLLMICSISRPDKPCEDTKNFVEKAKGLSKEL